MITFNSTYDLVALLLAAGWTIIIFLERRQQRTVVPLVQKRLDEIAQRRRCLIRGAFLGPEQTRTTFESKVKHYAFSGWVTLLPHARVRVADQVFVASVKFAVTARDERNIGRAAVTCGGDGFLSIESHGQKYMACFLGNAWEVQTVATR